MGCSKTAPAAAGVKPKARPLPKKGDIRSLAKHYREFSKKLLRNRLQSLDQKDREQFRKISKLSERHVRRLAQPETPARSVQNDDVKLCAVNLWLSLVKVWEHKATLTSLQEDLEDECGEFVSIPTLNVGCASSRSRVLPSPTGRITIPHTFGQG